MTITGGREGNLKESSGIVEFLDLGSGYMDIKIHQAMTCVLLCDILKFNMKAYKKRRRGGEGKQLLRIHPRSFPITPFGAPGHLI